MKILEIRQGSDEWDNVRAQMPTASHFSRIITAKKLTYSAQAIGYQAELVAKQLGAWTSPPPTYWMDWGTEQEPNAKLCYERKTGQTVEPVGFVYSELANVGCSPDGFVGSDGLIETKCPAPQTLIGYHSANELPAEYIPQVQGQLCVTGRKWCDFVGYHPDLPPFIFRVGLDPEFEAVFWKHMERFNRELAELKTKLTGKKGLEYLIDFGEVVTL